MDNSSANVPPLTDVNFDGPEIRTQHLNFDIAFLIPKIESEIEMGSESSFTVYQTSQLPTKTTIKAEQTDGYNPGHGAPYGNLKNDEYGPSYIFQPTNTVTVMFEQIPKSETQSTVSGENDSFSGIKNNYPDHHIDPDHHNDPGHHNDPEHHSVSFEDIKFDPSFVQDELLQSHSNPSDVLTRQQVLDKIKKDIDLGPTLTSPSPTQPKVEPTSTKGSLPHTIVFVTLKNKNVPKLGRVGSVGTFECKLCLTKLDSANDLKSHVSTCSQSHEDKSLYCVDCNKKYSCTTALTQHNLKNHGRWWVEADETTHHSFQFQCQFCPTKFVHRNSFKAHTESHVKNLDTTQNQNEANLKHKKQTPYKCQECDSTFSTVTNLTDHLAKAHAEPIFKCQKQNCGKSFKDSSKLKFHLDHMHSDIVKVLFFKCPHSGCKKSFKSKNGLKFHLKAHATEQALSDAQCGEAAPKLL